MRKNKYTFFVDLDQVIVNFNKQFKLDNNGLSDVQYCKKYSKEQFDIMVKDYSIEWWEKLEWMPDGKQLWFAIKKFNPIILTAHLHSDNTVEGKVLWLNRELPDIQYYIVPIHTKHLYAAENYVLIDDNRRNIKEWEEAGGIGILHTNTENTLEIVENLLQEVEE